MDASPVTSRLHAAKRVADSYDLVINELERQVEVTQSVVSLLQLVSMVLVISCAIGIALGAKQLLVDRLERLLKSIPVDLVDGQMNSEDEITHLEQAVYQITARLAFFKAEANWASQSSRESMQRMSDSLDFLFSFAALIRNSDFSDVDVRKILLSMGRAMNVMNVSMMFDVAENASSMPQRIYSHRPPLSLNQEQMDDMESSAPMSYFAEDDEGIKFHCLATQFSGSMGSLGVLQVEAEEDHLFDERDMQLVEVTAQLLSMFIGVHGREKEARRVALLEERSAIARELHDSLAQSLSFMKIQISRLQSRTAAGASENEIAEVASELRIGLNTAYQELRELLSTFRVHMDVRGLDSAIRSAIDEFVQRSGLIITLDNRLVNSRLTVNEEFHLLHVIRESLSNVVRHSGASSVEISLITLANGEVAVNVDDNGVGYIPASDGNPHYGQKIMKERGDMLGGSVKVVRLRKGGTRVRLTFRPKHVNS